MRRHDPVLAKRHAQGRRCTIPVLLVLLIIVALMAWACQGSKASDRTGSVTFTIAPPSSGMQFKAARFDCAGTGVAIVRALVRSADSAEVASGGPWPCDTGEGTISGVPAGALYTVTIMLQDSLGRTLYRGTSAPFDVVPGRVNDAGVITPQRVNSAPVFDQIAPITTAYDTLVTFTVNATDPDGDEITYSAVSLPVGAAFNAQTGVFTWTPSSSQTGTHTARFQATDDAAEPLSATLEVTIVVAGGAPVFDTVGSRTVAEGSTLNFAVHATDPEGTTVTYGVSNLPEGATFDAFTRIFSWTPGYYQSGKYTVRFTATDADGLTSTLDVSITVTDTNRPPVISSPAGTVHFLTTGVNSFTILATDPDGDSLTYDVAEMPRDWWGSYLDGPTFTPSTRTFSWNEPGAANAGEYKVLIRVTDSGSPRMSATAWVTIQVYDTPVQLTNNRYPVLSDIGWKTCTTGQQTSFTVSATDADDPTGDRLVYTVSSISGQLSPTGYTFAGRVFTWTPSAAGIYWLRFTVTDPMDHTGYGLSDSEDVVFRVGNVNRPPVLDPIGSRRVYNGATFTFVVTASDPDGDGVTLSAAQVGAGGLPRGATFNASTGTFSWNVQDFALGSYTIRFTATDNANPQQSDYEDVVFSVTQPPMY